MTVDTKKVQELEELRNRVHQLEAELQSEIAGSGWPPKGFYTEYYATTGFIFGMIGAAMSLLANFVGAPIAGKSPMELVRVYLTFPLGEKAQELATGAKDVFVISDSVILAIGCCLYLATGMILGVPFFIALAKLTEGRSTIYRLIVATVLASILYVVNFWGILSWLQPLLFGGNWITDPKILPPWVAWATHLVFGWTLALMYPWGKFQAYEQPQAH